MSSPKKSPERRRIDLTRLNRVTRDNVPIAVGYRNLSVDHLAHVEPTLADPPSLSRKKATPRFLWDQQQLLEPMQ
jgi:hypothetical protein